MKQTLQISKQGNKLLTFLAISLIFLSACDKPCVNCKDSYTKQRTIRQITHYDAGKVLKEKFTFFYRESLIDSIVKVNYTGAGPGDDSIIIHLKTFYQGSTCIPSSYEAKAYVTGSPASVEKAFLTADGSSIINKHIAFYPDENFLVVNKTADIDYAHNGIGNVVTRNGTDYHILIYPNRYSNENTYTYTGDNITKVVAQKEQAGYNLTNTFDTNPNPFNMQGGVLYYLLLASYPDEEYFETICLNRNNPVTMVYTGTDTSNTSVKTTFTFTYVYDSGNYPAKVALYEATEDAVHGNTETDHGTYQFTYYE